MTITSTIARPLSSKQSTTISAQNFGSTSSADQALSWANGMVVSWGDGTEIMTN